RPLDRLEERRLANAVRADDTDGRGRGHGDVVLADVLFVVVDEDPADNHERASSSGETASCVSMASSSARSPRSRNSVAKASLYCVPLRPLTNSRKSSRRFGNSSVASTGSWIGSRIERSFGIVSDQTNSSASRRRMDSASR